MAGTMQLVTAASADMPLRERRCRSAPVGRRQSAINPVADTGFARLAKGLTVALVMSAGIAAVACSAAADEAAKASRWTSVVAAPSSPVAAERQRTLAHPTDSDPATTYVEQLQTANALESSVALVANNDSSTRRAAENRPL